jgi:hypothetical protein
MYIKLLFFKIGTYDTNDTWNKSERSLNKDKLLPWNQLPKSAQSLHKPWRIQADAMKSVGISTPQNITNSSKSSIIGLTKVEKKDIQVEIDSVKNLKYY